MFFKLTNDEKKEILENYGGTKKSLFIVEKTLNLIDVIEDYQDYVEIVSSIMSQIESVHTAVETALTKEAALDKYLKINEIIYMELNRKYDYFIDEREEKKQKIKNFKEQKIRHN